MNEDAGPIFRQIATQLEDAIVDGSLAEESQAPSSNELAAFHRINPATAAKGLNQLLSDHRVPTAGRVEVFGRSPYEDDDVLSRMCFIKESQRYPDQYRVCDTLS